MSNIIKSTSYTPAQVKRLIEFHEKPPSFDKTEERPEEPVAQQSADPESADARKLSEQILQDAEEMAERMLAQARAEADRMLEEARVAIEGWWEERRQLDEQAADEASERGYRDGLAQGREEAEKAVKAEYAKHIDEARTVLELAHRQKEAVIEEAEPFLVELSVSIAAKLVHRQLSAEPDWFVDIIKRTLSRRREQGLITLCVSPGQYAFLTDAKEDLLQALDSQAELMIVPDVSVDEYGCVIRSAYGSLDAKVETQLAEIKRALLQIARGNEGTDAP